MRSAASMLELVIAIVVMGIAVMSLPLILTQSQNSNALALQQEAILATKAKIAYILAYEWDAHSYDTNASISRVLDTSVTPNDADDAFNPIDENSTLRIGHVNSDQRRRFWDVGHTNRNPNWGDHGWSDIDDFSFSGKDENITISAIDDYIFNINLHPSVAYLGDGLSTGSYNDNNISFNFDSNNTKTNATNIKMITVSTTSTTGSDINIKLRAFASNIGESKILKKAW